MQLDLGTQFEMLEVIALFLFLCMFVIYIFIEISKRY